MKSALPKWLRIAWVLLAPLGFLFITRIAYEKTILTWRQGPQMIGFSIMHVMPVFFIFGAICCYGLMLWPLISGYFLIRRHKDISKMDIAMNLLCVYVIVITVIPDKFLT
jgi:hypothetical protein